jgi:hypothetical protein
MTYAELRVTTHFSFLRGASSAEELFAQAAMLGIPALGVVDRNSLAGIVRAHEAAKVTGVRLLVGCRLDLEDRTALLVYPTDRAAYSRLCRLLSIGKGRAAGKSLKTIAAAASRCARTPSRFSGATLPRAATSRPPSFRRPVTAGECRSPALCSCASGRAQPTGSCLSRLKTRLRSRTSSFGTGAVLTRATRSGASRGTSTSLTFGSRAPST